MTDGALSSVFTEIGNEVLKRLQTILKREERFIPL